MKRIALVVLAAAAVVGIVIKSTPRAEAAPNPDPVRFQEDQFKWLYPQFFTKLNANHVDAGALSVGGISLNVSRGTLIYDMPALPTGGLITAGNSHICHDSVTTATVAACPFGSTLMLGIDQILPASVFGTCNPYLSAANTAFVRCCGFQNDAGAFNVPDASYTVTCIK